MENYMEMYDDHVVIKSYFKKDILIGTILSEYKNDKG